MRFLALFFLLPSLCFGQEWTREDTYRQSALTALLIADWAQTRWVVKNGFHEEQVFSHTVSGSNHSEKVEDKYEVNPFLGRHPSLGKVNNYFAFSMIGHAAIGHALPTTWRQGWQYFWIGAEANQVNRNRRIGVKMNF